MKDYHILNGDCLKESLKDEYSNLLIMREALMQGPIKDKDETIFFKKRAQFISQEYKACTEEEYLKGLDEFEKMKEIEDNTNINLWFGKDVFCQVNFWFLLDYLKDKQDSNSFYLVSPEEDKNCSFSRKRDNSFKNRVLISKDDFKVFSKLWNLFIEKEYKKMPKEIKSIEKKYPFLEETIQAIINMEDVEKEFIKLHKKENNFGKLFQKICQDYSIYGYGDLQVMYLLGIIENKSK